MQFQSQYTFDISKMDQFFIQANMPRIPLKSLFPDY